MFAFLLTRNTDNLILFVRTANQTPDAKANKDLPVGKCFMQIQSYCPRRLPMIPREAQGGFFTKVGDFLGEEPPSSPWT